MFKCCSLLIICIPLFSCHSIQKKSFKSKLDKNRIERCKTREKTNCNSKRKVCKLYDKKSNEECQSEFDKCIKGAVVECENQYH